MNLMIRILKTNNLQEHTNLYQMLSKFGPILDQFGTNLGHVLDQFWTNLRPIFIANILKTIKTEIPKYPCFIYKLLTHKNNKSIFILTF